MCNWYLNTVFPSLCPHPWCVFCCSIKSIGDTFFPFDFYLIHSFQFPNLLTFHPPFPISVFWFAFLIHFADFLVYVSRFIPQVLNWVLLCLWLFISKYINYASVVLPISASLSSEIEELWSRGVMLPFLFTLLVSLHSVWASVGLDVSSSFIEAY